MQHLKINLVPVANDDYLILLNLARFYEYDISEFFGDEPSWAIKEDGLYELGVDYKKYFKNKNAYPFFIRYEEKLAGFAIIDKESITPGIDFSVAQFFILRTYKRKGLGKQVALECFKKFPGTWEVRVLPKNETAYYFWRSIISEYTHNHFNEKTLKNHKGEDRIAFLFSNTSI